MSAKGISRKTVSRANAGKLSDAIKRGIAASVEPRTVRLRSPNGMLITGTVEHAIIIVDASVFHLDASGGYAPVYEGTHDGGDVDPEWEPIAPIGGDHRGHKSLHVRDENGDWWPVKDCTPEDV